MNCLNLAELFKKIAFKYWKNDIETEQEVKSIAIDLYIVLKWMFLITVLITSNSNILVIVFIVYLLLMNVHTYFYYHIWNDKLIRDFAHSKRRFVTLILALSYNILTYVYFYKVAFNKHFEYKFSYDVQLTSFVHSLSTTLTGSSDFVSPKDDVGLTIQITQVIFSFIFLSIIFSNTSISKSNDQT